MKSTTGLGAGLGDSRTAAADDISPEGRWFRLARSAAVLELLNALHLYFKAATPEALLQALSEIRRGRVRDAGIVKQHTDR